MDWVFPEGSEQDRAGKSPAGQAGPSRWPLHPAHRVAPTRRVAGSTQGQGLLAFPPCPSSAWKGGPIGKGFAAAASLGVDQGEPGDRVPLPRTRCSPGFSSLRLSPLPVSHRSSTGGIQTGTKPGTFCNQEKNKGSQARRQ